LEFQDKSGLTHPASGSVGTAEEVPPYTADEQVYLKEKERNEYHFLLEYGLKMYIEEDRAEGRSILRAFKGKDAVDEKPEDDEFGLMLLYRLRFYDDEDFKIVLDSINFGHTIGEAKL
jgi:hypothetical protein